MLIANRSQRAHLLIMPRQLVRVSGMADKFKVTLSVIQDNTQAPKVGLPLSSSLAL